MILMLLRTGMRIGELLALRMEDIDLREQKVFIYEARKTGVGTGCILQCRCQRSPGRMAEAKRSKRRCAVLRNSKSSV